jgi:ATP-binding cassette subfamily C protein
LRVNTNARPSPVSAVLRQLRGAFSSVVILSAVTNLLMLTGPLFMMQVYDRVLTGRSVPTLVALSLLALLLYAFLGLLEVIRARILSRIGDRLEEELGGPAFDAVLSLPLGSWRQGGGLQRAGQQGGGRHRTSADPRRDLDTLRQFFAGAGPVAICDMPWLPFYLALLFLFHPYLGFVALAGAVILIVLTLSNEAILRERMRRIATLAESRGDLVEAGRRNAEAVRAMGMAGAYAGRFRSVNARYVEDQRQAGDTAGGFAAVSKVLRFALQSAVLATGAWLAIDQLASPGVMIAASILTSRALAPVEQAIAHWRGFIAARQAAARLGLVLDDFADRPAAMPLPAPRERLDVAGLSLAASQMDASGDKGSMAVVPILQDISFSLKAGQAVGVIGPSGAGKSSLARALVGTWKPLSGTVRLDGAEIGRWDTERLGPSIGYLPQGVELFDGTVAENIARFSPDAQAGEVIAAARLAGVNELILSLPDGYDTRIGTGGRILSAGQRQRLGLARALFRDPFLIVLDEPNASLDAEGEQALTGAIAAMREKGSILVVIAHRPNALAAVDQTLVISAGRLVAFGLRDEVLRRTTVRAVGEKA